MHCLITTKVKAQGWQWYILVNTLVVEVVLIAKDMGALLICNPLQSQDMNTQTDASESRVVLGSLPSLGLLERRQETTTQEAIPLMLRSSSSGWATVRELPPPTPRETYLPQRLEHAHKREV